MGPNEENDPTWTEGLDNKMDFVLWLKELQDPRLLAKEVTYDRT